MTDTNARGRRKESRGEMVSFRGDERGRREHAKTKFEGRLT
jgi:hypothetical protein